MNRIYKEFLSVYVKKKRGSSSPQKFIRLYIIREICVNLHL